MQSVKSMKSKWVLGAAVGLLASFAVNADCVYPKKPASVPDGRTATEAQMMAGMAELKQFDSDVNAYGNCLDQETQARLSEGGADITDDQRKKIKAIQDKKRNAAVDELEAHAKQFNDQVRIYKEAQKKK